MGQQAGLTGAEGAVIGPALLQRQAVIAVAGLRVRAREHVVLPKAHRADMGEGLLRRDGKGAAAAAGAALSAGRLRRSGLRSRRNSGVVDGLVVAFVPAMW